MKKLLFITTVCCILSVQVFAQGALLGIKAGPSFSSAPFNSNGGAKPGLYAMAGIQLGSDGKKAQFGLGFNFGRQGFTSKSYVAHFNDNFFTTYIYANKKFNFAGSYVYTGVNVGLTIVPQKGRTYVGEYKQNGLQLGIQVGYSVPIGKKFNFFTEANAECYFINYMGGSTNARTAMIRIPVMVGLSLKI